MFLKEHGIHLQVAAAISTLYQNHPEVLPSASEWPKLALLVVKLLAGYRHPNSKSSEEVDEEEEDAFVRDTGKVSLMLPLVWGRSDDKDGVEGCLKAFYAIISTDGKI